MNNADEMPTSLLSARRSSTGDTYSSGGVSSTMSASNANAAADDVRRRPQTSGGHPFVYQFLRELHLQAKYQKAFAAFHPIDLLRLTTIQLRELVPEQRLRSRFETLFALVLNYAYGAFDDDVDVGDDANRHVDKRFGGGERRNDPLTRLSQWTDACGGGVNGGGGGGGGVYEQKRLAQYVATAAKYVRTLHSVVEEEASRQIWVGSTALASVKSLTCHTCVCCRRQTLTLYFIPSFLPLPLPGAALQGCRRPHCVLAEHERQRVAILETPESATATITRRCMARVSASE
jgi:hypothetical protein